tara:strand:- start:9001 stop:9558 length:558 start_codon:yes stop_codon:yes gene_type:complete
MNTNFYSPPGGEFPQELPARWVFADKSVREDLQTLSDSDLEALGWKGPITMPTDSDYKLKTVVWNKTSVSFDKTDFTTAEKEQVADYDAFWDCLFVGTMVDGNVTSESVFYKRLKSEAKTSLEANVLYTELVNLITDARNGMIHKQNIQDNLNAIMGLISFTTAETTNLQDILNVSALNLVYTLP